MKKISIIVSAIFMMACSNQDDYTFENPAYSEDEIGVVSINNGVICEANTRGDVSEKSLALSFPSVQAYTAFQQKLAAMSDAQRVECVKKLGITSLKELEIIADQELEEIGNSAQSEDEFRKNYELYKQKYKGILIPNDQDETDLNLYVPDGEKIDAFIANSDHLYVINHQIVKADLEDKVDCVMNRVNASAATSAKSGNIPVNNGCWSPYSGKKTYFESKMVYNYLRYQLYSKKKMWYGWKNDPARQYYMKTNLSNFTYIANGAYGQEIIIPCPLIYIYENGVESGLERDMGKVYNKSYPIKGRIRIWTDITVEHDANGNVATETVNGSWYIVGDHNYPSTANQVTIPKCLDSKAYEVDILWTAVN